MDLARRPQNYKPVNKSARAKKRARLSNVSVPLSPGLKRYLGSRGTPKGVYEIVRTCSTSFQLAQTGFLNGAGATRALSFTFTPQNVYVWDGGAIATPWLTVAVPNSGEMGALWEHVKLDKVECTFMGGVTQPYSAASGVNPYQFPPMIHYCTDDNDKACDAASIKQMADCKVWLPNTTGTTSIMRVDVKPKYQRIVYYSALTNNYEPARGYVRSEYDMEHYGLKMAVDDFPNNPDTDNPFGRINVSFKLFFKYKDLK